MAGQPWTEDEIDYIRESAPTLSSAEIAQNLKRSRQMVQVKARERGIKFFVRRNSNGIVGNTGRRWSQEEITRLWGLSERHTIREAAAKMPGRSYQSVANKVDELRISFKTNRLQLKDVAEIFGVNPATIARRRNNLGLNFRTGAKNKRSVGRRTSKGPTGADILALARDFLANPPGHNMTLTAKRLREIIVEYEGWE
jgi:hypothetical protein